VSLHQIAVVVMVGATVWVVVEFARWYRDYLRWDRD